MRVYIDANIYLQLFGPAGDKADYIGKIIKLIKAGDVVVIFPKITQNEVFRNIGSIYDQKLQKTKVKKSELQDVDEDDNDDIRRIKNKHIQICQESVTKDLAIFREEYQKTKQSVFNSIFKDLRFQTDDFPETDELVSKANFRHIKGYPPGKGPHIGDELAWEILLTNCLDDDLTIIATDPDWRDKTSEKLILNMFLREEWEQKTKKKIILQNSLGEFISQYPKVGKIKKEDIEAEERMNTIPFYRETMLYGLTGTTGPTGPTGIAGTEMMTGATGPTGFYQIGTIKGDTGISGTSVNLGTLRPVRCLNCNRSYYDMPSGGVCPECGLPTLVFF
ncbi:MAG: PIN domain-containing protein [Microgenomates group bacterium]